jgi:hypothetical protein
MLAHQIRFFAIRKKVVQESYNCQSLAKLHRFAQKQFHAKYENLLGDVLKQKVGYGIKLIESADRLLGKRVQRKSSMLGKDWQALDLEKLKRRVQLRILEDLDDVGKVTIGDIVETLEMLKKHGLCRTGKTSEREDV